MPDNITINKELGIIEIHTYGDVLRDDIDILDRHNKEIELATNDKD